MRRRVARHVLVVLISLVAAAPVRAANHDAGTLPTPIGPHAVGRMSLHLVDADREELETADPADHRELMVHLFYPAIAGDGQPAKYVSDAAEMGR